MELQKLSYDLTVCKLAKTADIDLNQEFFFQLFIAHFLQMRYTFFCYS